MDWRNTFSAAYSLVVNTTLGAVGNTLNVAGSLACMIGGAGFAAAYAIDESLHAIYYGGAHTTGEVDLNLYFPQYAYTFNETMPVERFDHRDGEISTQLHSYLRPLTVKNVSVTFMTAGLLLRLVGANLNLWLQTRQDRSYYRTNRKIDVGLPTAQEAINRNLASFLGSTAYVLQSNAIAGAIIDYSGWMGSSQKFTYPSQSEWQANSTYYNGPVNNILVPLLFSLSRNVNITLPIIGTLEVQGLINFNGNATVSYGGELLTESQSTPDYPAAVPATVGVMAYLGSTFFGNKAERQRETRIFGELSRSYSII